MRTVVYHDTETLARRARRTRVGETVTYRSIKEWDEKDHDKFDEVVNLSTLKPKKKKDES